MKIKDDASYLGAKKGKDYFEGWYYRHTCDHPFSVIVGISKSKANPHCFVQYIDNDRSAYFPFDIESFKFGDDMTVSIEDNVFSQKGIALNLKNDSVKITAEIKYGSLTPLKKTPFSPTVMGPFSYLPMFCNHCIASLKHDFAGILEIDGKSENLKGIGYIEKDYGSKFPENYFWMHAGNESCGIMCAVAWPLIFGIKGFICVVYDGDRQYNLSLYKGAKLEKFELTTSSVELKLRRGKQSLEIRAKSNQSAQTLLAPSSGGKMDIEIKENLNADVSLKFVNKDGNIALNNLTKCAFESVIK